MNELGENVSLLPVEESEPLTKKKKNLPPDQYSEECIHEQGQNFPSHMGDFPSHMLQIQNVLAQNSYKVYRLSGRISLKTYKTIFQTNKIKIIKRFEKV